MNLVLKVIFSPWECPSYCLAARYIPQSSMSSQSVPGKPEAGPKSACPGHTTGHISPGACTCVTVSACVPYIVAGLDKVSFPNCCIVTSRLTLLMLMLLLGCAETAGFSPLLSCEHRLWRLSPALTSDLWPSSVCTCVAGLPPPPAVVLHTFCSD